MPYTFWIIIFVQTLIFLAFFFYKRRSLHISLLKVLGVSGLFGIAFGFLFDTILGKLGVYSYISLTLQEHIFVTNLSLLQLIINGLFSFGLTIATAYYITPKSNTVSTTIKNRVSILFILAALPLLYGISFLSPGLLILFLAGTLILLIGELCMLMQSKMGPLLTLFIKREFKVFLRIWFLIIVVGLVCESINFLFPFWVWLPGLGYDQILLESLIIIFGYVPLIHPMMVFWQTVDTL